jgi:phosphoglycerate dehydrogenase-like enzyme
MSNRWVTPQLLVVAALAGSSAQAQTIDPKTAVAELGLSESARPVRELPGWRTPKKIAVVVNFTPTQMARLQQAAPGVEIVLVTNRRDSNAVAGADALIGPCSPAFIRASTELRWIHTTSAGVEDCIAVPELKQRRLLLTNGQHVSASVIAEHGLAMTLALGRRLDAYLQQQAQGRWTQLGRSRLAVASGTPAPPVMTMQVIQGKTALVVGLGGIGTEFAKRADALGMRVTAIRNTGRTGPEFVSHVGGPDELLPLAREADVIFSAVPLTPATTNLFDAKFFATVKPSALFINVGRGKSVVTADLIAALSEGRLGGAGLDVTEPEPLPSDHPLWKAPNLIITPHVGARSDLPTDMAWAVVYENIRRYAAGEKMLSVVDLERGY